MKLIPDWQRVLLRTYSSWSIFLGIVCLVLPPALFYGLSIEADPYRIGIAALVFALAGWIGRLIDQKRSGRLARLLFLAAFAFGVLMVGRSVGEAVYEDLTLPPAIDVEAIDAALEGWEDPFLIPVMAETPERVMPVRASGLASETAFLSVAVPFIGKWEGLRLIAYRDVVGVWTVCYGETKGITAGMSFTKRQCDEMLARELLDYRDRLHRAFTSDTLRAALPVHRDVAYTSLAYNVGVSAIAGSTAVRRLNAGNIAGGCKALTWYNKAGGRVWRGLVNRRAEDYQLCMIGVVV